MNSLQAFWKQVSQAVESREPRERLVVLLALMALMLASWLSLFHDPLEQELLTLRARQATLQGQVVQEGLRYQEYQNEGVQDPNVALRNRISELQASVREVDERLSGLYGQLVLPREMSQILTQLLQRETSLQLLNLENLSPEVVLTAEVDARPLVGRTDEAVQGARAQGSLQVFRHGLRLTLQGSYLDTLQYLRSLEQMRTNFLWENLEFQLQEHPQGRVSLEVYTLSTRRGYVGV